MVDEIRFPLNFTQCPNCGSERRVAGEVLETEKEKGKAKAEIISFLFQHQSVIAASPHFLSAPMVTTFYDACTDCGTVYCIRAQVQTVIPGGKIPPAQFSTS